MSLSKLTVLYADTTIEAKIIVTTASVMRGLLRSELTDQALREEPGDNPLAFIAKWTQYPALRAGTVEGVINIYDPDPEDEEERGTLRETIDAASIEFDQFLDLPEALATMWLGSIFQLNTHWLLDMTREPEEGTPEKKD